MRIIRPIANTTSRVLKAPVRAVRRPRDSIRYDVETIKLSAKNAKDKVKREMRSSRTESE